VSALAVPCNPYNTRLGDSSTALQSKNNVLFAATDTALYNRRAATSVAVLFKPIVIVAALPVVLHT
jgi:hypothetical protein